MTHMAGPLRNVRHERFVQALFEGQNATEAYATAGYVKDDGNATRLRNNPKVIERLTELQSEVAAESKVTVAGLIAELEEARQKATDLNQLSAAVRSIESKARISGLMAPQKLEIGAPGSFDKCTTVEEVVTDLLSFESPHVPVSDGDRRVLIKMFEAHFAAVEEFVAALRAKPISPEVAYKARRTELARLSNGKSRPVI